MLYYKGLGIAYDDLAKDYKLLLGEEVELKERFSSLSYVYDFVDSLTLVGAL